MKVPYSIPADKTFAVIELLKDDQPWACPVPTIWLKGVMVVEDDDIMKKVAICYWPPSETKLGELISCRRKPGSDWIQHEGIRVLKLCRTLQDTKNGANVATNNSDLSSSESGLPPKRKITPKEAFDPSQMSSKKTKPNKPKTKNPLSSTESETDDDLEEESFLISRNQRGNHSKDLPESESHEDDGMDNLMRMETEEVTAPLKEAGPKEAGPKEALVQEIASCSGGSGKKDATAGGSKSSTAANGRRRLFGLPSPFKRGSTQQYREWDGAIARELAVINKDLSTLHIKVDKIMISVCPEIELSNNNAEENGIPARPLADTDAEAAFEIFLKDQQNQLIMVKHLSRYGSSNGRRAPVNGILEKLLSNKVAKTYNFKGRQRADRTQKRAFHKSNLYTLVVAAVNAHAKMIKKAGHGYDVENVKDINSDIMAWLKDAPKRFDAGR